MRQKVTLTIEGIVIEEIDEKRGDISRSTYIQRILEKSLKLPKSP